VKTDKLSITLILKFASEKFSTLKGPQLTNLKSGKSQTINYAR